MVPSLSEPLLDSEIGSPPGALSPGGTSDFRSADAHAERVAAAGKARRELGGRLLCVGFFLRMLTVLNGLVLCVGVAYYVYCGKIIELLQDDDISGPVDLFERIRVAITCALPFLAGLGLLLLEWQSCLAEKAARHAIGCAFGPGGRCCLLLLSALVMVPLVHPEHAAPPADRRFALVPEWWVTAGAAAFTLLGALLQAWLLSCAPAFRTECVADFHVANAKHRLLVDASAFPQVYQRDEGAHLHLGVLLPGFSSRESCAMTANCSSVHLVGEVQQLEAPFAPVDEANSSAGPFGPFGREVRLAHPIDISTPVETRVGHGIFEFRFLKGYLPSGLGSKA